MGGRLNLKCTEYLNIVVDLNSEQRNCADRSSVNAAGARSKPKEAAHLEQLVFVDAQRGKSNAKGNLSREKNRQSPCLGAVVQQEVPDTQGRLEGHALHKHSEKPAASASHVWIPSRAAKTDGDQPVEGDHQQLNVVLSEMLVEAGQMGTDQVCVSRRRGTA